MRHVRFLTEGTDRISGFGIPSKDSTALLTLSYDQVLSMVISACCRLELLSLAQDKWRPGTLQPHPDGPSKQMALPGAKKLNSRSSNGCYDTCSERLTIWIREIVMSFTSAH